MLLNAVSIFCSVQSIVTGYIMAWIGNSHLTITDAVKSVRRTDLPPIEEIYMCCLKKAHTMLATFSSH